jgi:mono/diheme cytochrome c family protein
MQQHTVRAPRRFLLAMVASVALHGVGCGSDPQRPDVEDEDPEELDASSAQAGSGGRGGSGGASAGSGGTSAGGQTGTAGSGGGAGSGGTAGSGAPDAGADASVVDAREETGADARPADAGSGGGGDAGGGDAGGSPALAFFQQTCAPCHGAMGEGTRLGPEIQHPPRDYFNAVVRAGRTHPNFPMPMPRYTDAQLSPAMRDQIRSYLDSFPKPMTGKALYLDFCGNCHGADARGGLSRHTLRGRTLTFLIDNVRRGHHPERILNRTSYMPAWGSNQLSNAEIDLIHKAIPTL